MSQDPSKVASFSQKNLTLSRDGKPRCVVLENAILEVYTCTGKDEGKKGNELKEPNGVEYAWRCTYPAQGSLKAINKALKCANEKSQSKHLTKTANVKSESDYLTDIANLCVCTTHQSVAEAAVQQWTQERQHQSQSAPESPSITSESQRSGGDTPTTYPLPKTPTKQTAPRTPSPTFSNAAPKTSYGNLLWKDLGSNDTKSGWLYVFCKEGLDGYYKLGYTTVPITDTRNRLRDQEKCYGPIRVVTVIEIDNVTRYEKLIFCKLSEYRRCWKCPNPKCGKTHREWLQIDKQSLLEALYAWQRLSSAGLYSPDGKLDQKFIQSPSSGSPSLVDDVLTEYYRSSLWTPGSKPKRTPLSTQDLSNKLADMSLQNTPPLPSRTGDDDDDDDDDDDAVGQSSPSLRKQRARTSTARRRSARLKVQIKEVY